jgi:hypothetical protein
VCRVWARAAMPSGTVQAREKAGKIADSHLLVSFCPAAAAALSLCMF